MNATAAEATVPERQPPAQEIDRQMVYTLNPLSWREGDDVRRVPSFARVGLPRRLLAVALQSSACRPSQCASGADPDACPWQCGHPGDLAADDPQMVVDLDSLLAGDEGAEADVA